jgi:hypothetical protein
MIRLASNNTQIRADMRHMACVKTKEYLGMNLPSIILDPTNTKKAIIIRLKATVSIPGRVAMAMLLKNKL